MAGSGSAVHGQSSSLQRKKSFETFDTTSYFCGSKYMVAYKVVKELCKLFNKGNDLSEG